MTLLHQAAQKAVEALNAVRGDKSFCCLKEERTQAVVLAAIAQLSAALQHQEVPREPVADDARKAFEDAVFNRRFRASIKRNPNPPKGFGGLDFVSMNCPTQAELCRRDAAGDYEDETVSAMWWGWRKALAASPSTTRQQEARCGSHECKAAQQDGVICADGECDIAAGQRATAPSTPEKAGGVSDGVPLAVSPSAGEPSQ